MCIRDSSVAVGETNPPQAIIESVVRKVQTTQENERKETELKIARKDIAIPRARGEAEGAMKMEIARQEANAGLLYTSFHSCVPGILSLGRRSFMHLRFRSFLSIFL